MALTILWLEFILKLDSKAKSHYISTRCNFSPLLQDTYKAIRVDMFGSIFP